MAPRIRQVQTGDDYVLHVTFENGITKLYDIKSRLNDERFKNLRNRGFFESVQVDKGGFGVSWDDDIDLSENELWTEGKDSN
jgi:hypothetical protein